MAELSNEDFEEGLVSDFDFNNFCTMAEQKTGADSNAYVEEVLLSSDLLILQEGWVKAEYEKAQAVGLFHLFFTRQYFQVVTAWTNKRLKADYNMTISYEKLLAFVGLEMAMGIVLFNSIPG